MATPLIRVLHLIDSLEPGGAERSLAELVPALRRHGIGSQVVCLAATPGGLAAQIEKQVIPVRALAARTRARRVLELRRLLRAERPQVLHTTLVESDIAGRLAAAGLPIAVLTSLVNTSYAPVRRRDPRVPALRLQAARRLDAWTARRLTDHFHAVTEAVKVAAVGALGIPADRITVIERGRDPERLGSPGPERRLRARRALGLDEHDEVLLNVGRQEFQKGQDLLLRALALLAGRPRLVALFAGARGHCSGALEELRTRLGLTELVRFLGHREDVPDLLAAADLLVLPSLYEGAGGSLIEAMALGVPAVVSDLPSLRETSGEGRAALHVPVGSAPELAAAIRDLLDAPERARALGAEGRRIFCQRFTLERSADRLADLLRRLAGERTAPASSP